MKITQKVNDAVPEIREPSGVTYALLPEGWYNALITTTSHKVYGTGRRFLSVTPTFHIDHDNLIYEISRQEFVVGELNEKDESLVEGKDGALWSGVVGAKTLLVAIGAFTDAGLNFEPEKFAGMPVRVKVEHAAYFVSEDSSESSRQKARTLSNTTSTPYKAKKYFNAEHVPTAVQSWNAANAGSIICKAKNFVTFVGLSDNVGYVSPEGWRYLDEASYKLVNVAAKLPKNKRHGF